MYYYFIFILGNHPSTRNQRIICTSPANNSYQHRGFTNNNYNSNYNHHQNYRPNTGNKHQYNTGNYQPHFSNFTSSHKRHKRKNQTQDVR